jgi:hypothetical protein
MHSQENVNEVVRNDLADILGRLEIVEEKISMASEAGQRVPRESRQKTPLASQHSTRIVGLTLAERPLAFVLK